MQRFTQCERDTSSAHSHSEDCIHGHSILSTDTALQSNGGLSRSVQHSSSTGALDALAPNSLSKSSVGNKFSKAQRSSLLLMDASTRLWTGQPICLHDLSLLKALKDASKVAPMDRDGVSALDAQKLADNIHVRYDINHDRHIVFGSTPDQRHLDIAEHYYSAVAFEIVVCLSGALTRKACDCSGIFDQSARMQPYLNRLPKFLASLRKIVRSLIRTEHWQVVDQAIDPELLMSQFNVGSCDLLSLALWLGDILKQSCSPLRDSSVDKTMQILAAAIQNSDGRQLTQGLSSLFDVFNTMKLDVINHQMRILLPPMVDESINFVQEKYRRQIDDGVFDYKEAWKWYHERREFHDARAFCDYHGETGGGFDDADVTALDEDFLTRYIDIVFEEVIMSNTPLEKLPKAFELDHRRIYDIRRQVSKLQLQQSQLRTFHLITRQFGVAYHLSIQAERELLQRLEDIQSQPTQRQELLEALAVEIARTAYIMTGQRNRVPEDEHVCQARDLLDIENPAGFRLAIDVQEVIHSLIEQQVFEEISGPNGISDLLPSQILDRYKPLTRTTIGSNILDDLPDRIKFIAQSLAHVTLIQWRVWAQLLWFKPKEAIFDSEEEYLEWQKSVDQAIWAKYPHYQSLKQQPRDQSRDQSRVLSNGR